MKMNTVSHGTKNFLFIFVAAALLMFLPTASALDYYWDELDLDTGNIAYWKLDETTGTIATDSTGSNNGTISGASINQTGKIEKAYSFDGTNDYIEGSALSSGEQQGTFSCWVKRSSTTTADTMMTFNRDSTSSNSYQEFYISAGKVKQGSPTGGLSTNWYTDDTIITDTNWHHVVILSTGTAYKVYVDNIEYSISFTAGSNDGKWNADLPTYNHYSIGALTRAAELYNPHHGLIDEVGIWDVALTETQIAGLFNFQQALVYGSEYGGPTNLTWSTTGGFTDDTLLYGQVLDYINVTSTACNITVTDPDGTDVVDATMTNYTTGEYTYTTDITLNKAGNWTITINNGVELSDNITVSIQSQSTKDGWYGYAPEGYLNLTEIITLADYGYDIFEFEENMTELQASFSTLLTSINDSRNVNIKSGINIIVDFDYNSTGLVTQYLTDISEDFAELNTVPYADSIIYISLELEDMSSYPNATLDSILNQFAQNITGETDNAFIIYSNNYNSTGLDSSYIEYTQMLYFGPSTSAEFIEEQKTALQEESTLNRIYTSIIDAIKELAADFQTTIIDTFRGTPDPGTLTNDDAASLSNDDVVVFNNGSSTANFTVDTSELSVTGLDVWDSTYGWIVEMDNDDDTFIVSVPGYSATTLFFEELDHIQMDTLTSGTVYSSSSPSVEYSNYTDDVSDGSWLMSTASDMQIEIFDGHYTHSEFITYYGWLNATALDHPGGWESYEVAIIADQNNAELDSLNYSATDFYAYVSVQDYNNTDGWNDAKEVQVDEWLALNDSLHIFIDGLDYATVTDNFSVRMKELVDYIQITKARKAILNTYTAYDDFATWGDGGVMKESCVNRWNGVDAENPDNYTREDWDLELERSEWFTAHGVPVFCQSFDERTDDGTNTIVNYTELQNIYFASKVLGYDSFWLSQPDFQHAHDEYVYDVGAKLGRSAQQLTADPNVYYRAYENGIVYYNTTSEQGWIDDGLIINEIETCFYLYNNYAGNIWNFNINERDPTGSVGEYSTIQSNTFTWEWVCVDTTAEEPINGRYLVEAWVGDHTVSPGYNLGWSAVTGEGRHSWYDTSATDAFTAYPTGQNWMVSVNSNFTTKVSLDTTPNILQTVVDKTMPVIGVESTNITLSSTRSFPLEVWSKPTTVEVYDFDGIYLLDDDEWVELNYSNNTDCDTDDPTWGTTETEDYITNGTIDDSGWTNPTYAFDDGLQGASVFYAEGGASSARDDSLGLTFDATYVSQVYIFAWLSTTMTGDDSVILETYDGATWSTETTLFTETGSYNETYSLNSIVQGIRVAFISTGSSPAGGWDARLYHLQWVNGSTIYKACVEPSGSDTIVRIAAPSLSERVFQVTSPSTVPLVDFVAPTPDNYSYLGSAPVIAVNITEDYFEKITFNINGNETEYTDGNRSHQIASLADGEYFYNVTVLTTIGYSNTSETRSFVIDTVAPFFDLVNVTTPIIYNVGDNVSIDFQVTDTNLDRCWYTHESELPPETISLTLEVLNKTTERLYVDMEYRAPTGCGGMFCTMAWTPPYGLYINGAVICGYNMSSHAYSGVSCIDANISLDETFVINGENTITLMEDGGCCGSNLFFTEVWTGRVREEFSCTSGVEVSLNATSVAAETELLFSSMDLTGNLNTTIAYYAWDVVAPTVDITNANNRIYIDNLTSKELNWTVNDSNLDSCWYTHNGGSNIDLNCTDNTTIFNVSAFGADDTIIFYANDTLGNVGTDSINFTAVNITLIPADEYTFETETKYYQVNLNKSSNVVVTPTLNWNGVSSNDYTVSGTTDYNFTYVIPVNTVGLLNQTNNWNNDFSMVYFGGSAYTGSSDNQTQQSYAFTMNFCDSGNYTTLVANFTFQDETTFAKMNATLDASTWEYSVGTLGTGASKTFTYANTTGHNYDYAFCVWPDFVPSVSVTASLQYSHSEEGTYPQRKYNVVGTTYTTANPTNYTLTLLNYNNGITSSYQVFTIGGTVIADTYISFTRDINGVATKVADGYTDSSGTLQVFLNPNFLHTLSIVKEGYATQTQTIFPSQQIYSITLGTEAGQFQYDNPIDGITYTKSPPSGTIGYGEYNFTYNVYSHEDNIYNCTMLIAYANGTEIATATGCNSSYPALNNGGVAWVVINTTLLDDQWIGKYSIETENGTIMLEADARWVLIDFDGNGLTGFNGALRNAINDSIYLPEWGSNETTRDFNRIVAFFLFLAITLAILNFFTGYDTAYPGAFLYIMTGIVFIMSGINGIAGPGYFYLSGATNSTLFGEFSAILDNWVMALHFLLLTAIYFFSTNKRYQSG